MTNITTWVNKDISVEFLNEDGDILSIDEIDIGSRERMRATTDTVTPAFQWDLHKSHWWKYSARVSA